MAKKGKTGNKYRSVKIDHEETIKKRRKEYQGIVFLAIIFIITIVGGSYALFSNVLTSKKEVEVEAGTFVVSFKEGNYINLENTYPMTDEEGLNTKGYKFSIENTGTLDGVYDIYLEEDSANTLEKGFIKYSIKEYDGSWSTPQLLSTTDKLLVGQKLDSKQKKEYVIKIWLDENASNDAQGKTYKTKIVVDAIQAPQEVPTDTPTE